MGELAELQCVPCRGGVPPLSAPESQRLLAKLSGWAIVENHHLRKGYDFSDFATALQFVNAIGALAEEQGHHPDLVLRWGHVGVEIWTHKIHGLTESDFILADKIDQLRPTR